jgi:hypothetical protein
MDPAVHRINCPAADVGSVHNRNRSVEQMVFGWLKQLASIDPIILFTSLVCAPVMGKIP